MKAKFFCYLPYRVFTGLLIIMCLHSPGFSQSGKAGSLAYLKASNGIGGFTLGNLLTSEQVQGLTYLDGEGSKPDADSCVTYEYHPDKPMELEGGLTASHICIRSYENRVVNIYVFFNRDQGYKMLSKFLHWYGTFTAKPNDYQDVYMWESRTVKLMLSFHPDDEQGIAVYTSVPLTNVLNAKNAKRLTQLLTSNDK
ncbi:hypothetical protein MTO98_26895 [Mucilaginibacter sp. SMC90]|uniref:hypothetical protein n=1 Tax=Mucilaginibacter sp. SMC90 TaxID=2929803 RepID=UPI001FB41699|nr:hypothetical protein [Mucilaginibacter sp. SMC90]UOE48044.1 hypothetical protein MTO98_26895 [Mucilaginibacter sp. SMC90]